jgi:hypothetical protein
MFTHCYKGVREKKSFNIKEEEEEEEKVMQNVDP